MSVGPTPSSQDGLGGPLVEQITDGPPGITPPAAASSKPAAVTLESTPKPTGSSSSKMWPWGDMSVELLRRLQRSVLASSEGCRWPYSSSSHPAAHPATHRRPNLPPLPLQCHPLCCR
ncbi:hypothetical protein OEZ85_005620 [Tetradesmus obliquus]|uniref:Uncharacterized protein n=1 Tax=Tetradesmus obliquus TaxID=3088 RepID=A0ABY8UEJ5_TETOB|nr:hypothetical protein OEZ85_005620 [Tetradesmus obliquus]